MFVNKPIEKERVIVAKFCISVVAILTLSFDQIFCLVSVNKYECAIDQKLADIAV